MAGGSSPTLAKVSVRKPPVSKIVKIACIIIPF
nr:MAG TPA: hypothetical protein [Caudoviricetes sp.]